MSEENDKKVEETEDEEKLEADATETAKSILSSIEKLIDAKYADKKEEVEGEPKEMSKETVKSMDAETRSKEFIRALLLNDHQKLQVLAEGNNALGGYLVPTVLYNQIVEEQRDVAVIRPRATVIDPCPKQLNIDQLATRPKVYWRSEAATKSTSTLEFSQISLTPYSLAVIVVLTKELVADAEIPSSIIQYIINTIATAIAEEEDKAFMTGNGSGRPTGIDNYSGTVSRSVTTPANVVAADSLISAFYKLGQKYRRNAVWLMNSLTLAKVMQLKDGQNRYLFLADPTGQTAGTLLGRPVYEQNDLTQSRIWLGDLSGYWIGVREGITVMQSEQATVAGYSTFERNEVAVRVEERVDGEMADTNAFVVVNGTN